MTSPRLFAGGPILQKEITQSLVQFRHWARNIESGTEALMPLASTATGIRLTEIINNAKTISDNLKKIYDEIAREALSSEG